MLTACSGDDGDTAEVHEIGSTEPKVTLEAPVASADDPSTGFDACKEEILETVVNPETVTFGESATYEEVPAMGDGLMYSTFGAATSTSKHGDSIEYEWHCRMLWHDDAWKASYATVDLEPTVVKHRDRRPSTARDICEESIKSQLVSPRSAEFTHSRDGIDESGPDEYVLYGLVESQNRMGVWLESTWTCGVSWDADNDTWEVGRKYVR